MTDEIGVNPRQYRNPSSSRKQKRTKVTDIFPKPVPIPGRKPTINDPLWRQALEQAAEYPYPDPDEALNQPGPDPDQFMQTHPQLAIQPAEYTETEPWGQMERESDASYEKFTYYRSLGSARTLLAVAEKFGNDPTSISLLGKKHHWHRRIRAWDEYREKVYTVELVEQTKSMAHQHAEVAAKGIRSLATVFDAIEQKYEADPTEFMADLTTRDAKQLFNMARAAAQVLPNLMNAERLSRGLPTEISASLNVHEHRITIQTRDELAEIAFGLADVLAGSQEETVIDVGGGDWDTLEETHPKDEQLHPD